MKKILIITKLSVLIYASSWAQVYTGNLQFLTQNEVNQFLIENPTTTSIIGDVSIISNSGSANEIVNIDALQNITSIIGNVVIVPSENISLNGFGLLTSISGSLIFDGANANGGMPNVDLTGFENLISVNALDIIACELDNLDMFDALSTVEIIAMTDVAVANCTDIFPGVTSMIGFDFNSTGNSVLIETFSGFNFLTSIDFIEFSSELGFPCINNFDAFHNLESSDAINFSSFPLVSCSGFEMLHTVNGTMIIDCLLEGPALWDFPLLSSIANIFVFGGAAVTPSFPSLINVPGDVYIGGYPDTIHFVALQTVGGHFTIYGDFGDDSFSNVIFDLELNSLTSVGGNFSIFSTQLTELNCNNLQTVGGAINIVGNPNLTYCTTQALCSKIASAPELVLLDGNSDGDCESISAAAATCNGLNFAHGVIYVDLNCDGLMNGNDTQINNMILLDESNQPVGSVYSNGNYFINLPDVGTTVITTSLPAGAISAATYTFNTTGPNQAFPNSDFGVCMDANAANLGVSFYSESPPRPGFSMLYLIRVQNYLIADAQGHVMFDLSNMPGAIFSESLPMGTQNGSLIEWDIDILEFNQIQYIQLWVQVAPTVPLGTVYTPAVSVVIIPNSITDIDLSNNSYSQEQTVVGSYDPNDKQVDKANVLITEAQQDGLILNYTIRFQNTGTAEAINVSIEDEIETQLDLSTFEMVAASHDYQVTFHTGGMVEWLFENIMLPDSSMNEDESHGFIQFRIKTASGLSVNDVIENSASIYFDFNEPIITNSATTSFYQCPGAPVISGQPTVCLGDEIEFNANSGWNTYDWIVDETPTCEEQSCNMTLSIPGEYAIQLITTYLECTAMDELNITVYDTPETPSINQSGDLLTATEASTYQWFLNGNEIPNATMQTFEITQTGNYSVMITDENGCSAMSEEMMVTYTGVGESTAAELSLFPNPADTKTLLGINEKYLGTSYHVYSTSGELVLIGKLNSRSNPINCENLAPGVYVLRVDNEHIILVKS